MLAQHLFMIFLEVPFYDLFRSNFIGNLSLNFFTQKKHSRSKHFFTPHFLPSSFCHQVFAIKFYAKVVSKNCYKKYFKQKMIFTLKLF